MLLDAVSNLFEKIGTAREYASVPESKLSRFPPAESGKIFNLSIPKPENPRVLLDALALSDPSPINLAVFVVLDWLRCRPMDAVSIQVNTNNQEKHVGNDQVVATLSQLQHESSFYNRCKLNGFL